MNLFAVPSDLAVSFKCRSAFQKVHSLEDGAGAVFLTYFNHGPLDPLFFLQRVVIYKEIQLIHTVILCRIVCADTQPPVKQPVVRLLVKRQQQCLRNSGDGIGSCLHLHGTV